MCICCSTRCTKRGSGECVPNGGISRLLTGRNICRKRQDDPLKSPELIGKASCERQSASWFGAACMRSCVACSVGGLCLDHRRDWIAHRFFFKKSSRSDRHLSPRTYQLLVRMA